MAAALLIPAHSFIQQATPVAESLLISPQSLAVATAAVERPRHEGELFRRVVGYSVGLVLFMSVVVYLQSTLILSWMLP